MIMIMPVQIYGHELGPLGNRWNFNIMFDNLNYVMGRVS